MIAAAMSRRGTFATFFSHVTVVLRTHKNPNAIEQQKKFFHYYKKKSLMNVASLMQGVKRNTKVLHFRYKIKKKKSMAPVSALRPGVRGGRMS